MTSTDRRSREKADVYERILAAARTLFVERGYEQVTMRQIADAIEYTPGALYVHFKDKRDLMLALCRHDFGQFHDLLHGLLQDEPDPVARIWKMGGRYMEFARRHPRHYELMFLTKCPVGVEPDPEDLARIEDPSQNGYAFLILCVHEALNAGKLRPELTDALVVAQTLWGTLHGTSALYITFEQDPWVRLAPFEDAARLARANVLRGLLRDPSTVDRLLAEEAGGNR
jgi:AcrR family transcriptional regulator